ncbi:MAG TPA: hypothetical protein VI958_01240, partial [Acidobacteriota bacterium]
FSSPFPKKKVDPLPGFAKEETLWPYDWSKDGKFLLGQFQKKERRSGVGVYSLENKKLERLTERGTPGSWLKDNRRILFDDEGKLFLIDIATKKIRLMAEPPPGNFFVDPDAVDEDRLIYFEQLTREADIWMATLQ